MKDLGSYFPPELFPGAKARRDMEEQLANDLFQLIVPGWSPENEHQKDTPKRFVRALRDLTHRPEEFKFTTFQNKDEARGEMVYVGPIDFHSLCAHHVLPFHGVAHVAYVPDNLIAGISKLPRTVKHHALGLHVQEDLTTEIADFLEKKLEPIGVAVIMRAEHMCMSMRGVKETTETVTTAMRGCFLDPTKDARAEFLALVNNG